MKQKIYFFMFILTFSNIFSQTQNINYGNINFEISSKYQMLNKELVSEATKTIRDENKKLNETFEQIDLDYNERTTFSFKNQSCNCLNNLVLSQTKIGFSFSNNSYSSNSELQKEIKEMYDENIEANKEQISNTGIAKITKINPTSFNKTKNINYFHISSEMVMLKNNKTIVVDIFTIPVENFFYQLEFSTDKVNYDTVLPLIKEMVNSIIINE